MMSSEVPNRSNDEQGRFASAKRGLIATGGGVAILFLVGIATGYTAAALDHGVPSTIDFVVLGAVALLITAVAWSLWRYMSRPSLKPEAPRVKRARNLVYAMGAIGGVLGILLAVGNDTSLGVFSNGPINPTVAIVAGVIFLTIVPVATWMWWKSIDDHEAGAYRDGSLIAIHAYFFIVPTWWLAARAGFVPSQDPMVVLLIVSTIWGAAWFGRRYI